MKRRLARGMTAFLCIAAALPATMARAGYQFTTIDPPGPVGFSIAFGVNNAGQAVGTSLDADFNTTAFLHSDGVSPFLSVPGAVSGSEANGINNTGTIVGDYSDANFAVHGFILEGGNFPPFDPPGAVIGANATGVNDLGTVIGNDPTPSHRTSYMLSSGVSTPITSGFAGSTVQGINNAGRHRRVLQRLSLSRDRLPDPRGRHHRDPGPGRRFTFANGINNAGTIVGDYTTATGASGFVLSGGVFTTIQVPGAAVTEIYGINDSGMIVGDYSDADGNVHAFIATSVPEPSSALLAGISCP